MSRRKRTGLLILLSLLVAVFVVPILWHHFERFGTGLHQQSVTRSFATWEREYSHVSTAQEARRATDMLEYIATYYTLSEGYRSRPEIELQLEAARKSAIDAISAGLEEYRRANPTSAVD